MGSHAFLPARFIAGRDWKGKEWKAGKPLNDMIDRNVITMD